MKIDKNLLILRGEMLDSINEFFKKRGFLKIETPSIYLCEESNPHIESIEAEIRYQNRDITATLITSPEIYMKRFLSECPCNIYQICKFFRNNEFDSIHNPEFTGLEFYEVGRDYKSTMNTTEEMIKYIVEKHNLHVKNKVGRIIDFSMKFQRVSIIELLSNYGVVLSSLEDRDELVSKLRNRISISESDNYDDIIFKFFLTYIEPELGKDRPVFLYDYPPSMASMAKISIKNGIRVSERYELYFNGVEICNGFTELTDPEEQAERLKRDLAIKGKDKIDRVFVESIRRLPECSGNAIGLDRLFMVLLNLQNIKDLILFPLDEEINLYKV